MTDSYQPSAEPAPAAPPPTAPPSAAPEPSPAQPSGASFDSKDLGRQWEGERLVDGHPREHASHYSAAQELARTRRERAEAQGRPNPQDFLEDYVEEVGYLDGRPKDQEVEAKDAAAELADYRRQRNEQLKIVLDELEGRQRPADPQQQPFAPETQAQQPQLTPLAELEAQRDAQLPQLQSRLAELEAARREHVEILRSFGAEVADLPEQQAAVQAQQQALAYIQAAAQARDQHELALTQLVAEVTGANLAEFADLKTESDLARLQQTDVMKYNRFRALQTANQQFRSNLNQLHSARQQQQFQQQQQYQQQFAEQRKAYNSEQDKRVEQLVPELAAHADAGAREALQRASLEVLKAAGFSHDEIAAGWNAGPLRDARSQKIVSDAAKWRMAQARALQAQTRPYPAVQRPGVAQAVPRGEYEQRQLSERIDSATGDQQVRLAAQLLGARRAAARR